MPSTPLISRLSPAAMSPLAGVLLLALSLAPARAAEETPPPSPLAKLHARVERAFGRCDAGILRPLLSRRVKTFVDSRVLAPSDGYYGADQLLLLFERLFERRTTISFTALSADLKPRRDGRARLPIRWISREGGSSRNEISLTLILDTEGATWHIREIRDLK